MFNNKYSNTLSRDGRGERGPESCILPFFGFKYDTESDSYTQGVYVSDPDKLSGLSKVYGTHSIKVEFFYRDKKPTGEALRLEERFLALQKDKNPWNMKYIEPGISKFYTPWNAPRVGFLISVVLTVLWFVLLNYTHPLCIHMFGEELDSFIFLFVAPIVITMASFIFSGIIFLILKILGIAPPKRYCDLSEEQKEKVRKKYFERMVHIYGAEAGAILKEYAILKRYVFPTK